LWIADEILVGAGRTGTWSALEPYGVWPDLLTLGKGISGGYVPLSALLAPRRVVDVLAQGSGALLHAQTFSHHPVACAAGLAAIAYIESHQLVARCAVMGTVLHQRLERLRTLPAVGDIRGRGLLAGIELVADRGDKRPFPPTAGIGRRVAAAAFARGLILLAGQPGLVEGLAGDHLLLAPPYVITKEQIESVVEILGSALAEVAAEAG
jgi:adenosylmethionine-8-amino-7-oxononanoate aminotransferase